MSDLEVKLDPYATDDEVRAVAAVISAYGIDPDVTGGYKKFRYGELTGEADEPEWIIVLVLGSTFGAFLSAFFSQAGSDAWKGLRRMVDELRASRREPTGSSIPPSPPHVGAVYIRDQYGNELGFDVYPEMPDADFWKAWESIHEPDWAALGGWHVMWDDGQWVAIESMPGKGRVMRWDRNSGKWMPVERGKDAPSKNERGLASRLRKRWRRSRG